MVHDYGKLHAQTFVPRHPAKELEPRPLARKLKRGYIGT